MAAVNDQEMPNRNMRFLIRLRSNTGLDTYTICVIKLKEKLSWMEEGDSFRLRSPYKYFKSSFYLFLLLLCYELGITQKDRHRDLVKSFCYLTNLSDKTHKNQREERQNCDVHVE